MRIRWAVGLAAGVMVFLVHVSVDRVDDASAGTRVALRAGPGAAAGFLRRAIRRLRRAAARLKSRFRRFVRRVAQRARRVFRAVTRRVSSVVNKVKKVGKALGSRIKKAVKKVGAAVTKVAKKIGKAIVKGFDWAKKMFCKTIGGVFCAFIGLIKGAKNFVQRAVKLGLKKAFRMAIDDVKNAIKSKIATIKNEAQKVFAAFKSVLTAEKYSFPKIFQFSRVSFPAITKLAAQLLTPLMPFPFGAINAVAIGAIGTGVLTPTLAAMAALHFGLKKLLAWIIPKMVLGAGNAFNFVNKALPPGFKRFVGVVAKLAGIGGPGLLAGALSLAKPETRARLNAIFLRIANVAGKIQQGIDGAMRVAQAARSGSFAAAETALDKNKPGTTELTRADLSKMIDALAQFAREQVLLALDAPLRRVVGFGLQGINRLLDVPRNALVAAVGSIPIAGGALAAAVNAGLGIIVDMVNQFAVQSARRLADLVLGDVIEEVKKVLKRTLLDNQKNVQAAAGFAKLMQIVAKLAGSVNRTLRSAAAGRQALFAQMAIEAINTFIQRGVRNPQVRQILSQALDALSNQLTQQAAAGARFTLAQGVATILRATARPLGQLVSSRIRNPRLASAVGRGLEALLTSLASAGAQGLRKIMANPMGFLTTVGRDLLSKVKPDLVELLTGKIQNPTFRQLAAQAVDKLITELAERGFSALMGLSEALNRAKARLARFGAKVGAAGRQVLSAAKLSALSALKGMATRFAGMLRRNCPGALKILNGLGQVLLTHFPATRARYSRVLGRVQALCRRAPTPAALRGGGR